MGFRFPGYRRTVRVARGVRLSLGKRGPSLSVDTGAGRITINSGGQLSVGLPRGFTKPRRLRFGGGR